MPHPFVKCPDSAPIRQETSSEKRQAASEIRELAQISLIFGDRKLAAEQLQYVAQLDDEASLDEAGLARAS
jgi:hypothetical protein